MRTPLPTELVQKSIAGRVTPLRSVKCVDLFCGLGGLTFGLKGLGIDVVAGIDVDPCCRFPYESNNHIPFIERDIRGVSGKEVAQLLGKAEVRILAGCAPCQPFSTYSRKGENGRNGDKWSLVSDFGRLVQEVQPEVVTMENVPHLVRHPVFHSFNEALEGYSVSWSVVECSQYGVPQTRKRLVLLASRLGKIELLPLKSKSLSKKATVRDAIFHLPAISAGDVCPKDPLHTAPSLSSLNLKRIQASKPGGSWRDWDTNLIADCHRKHSGQTYPSVYGRMEWDQPAPTITTQCFGFGNGRFGHPEQDRAISLREAALLQTFPEGYKFLKPDERVRFSTLGRLIGNAVPVKLAEVIGQSLLSHIQKFSPGNNEIQ